MECCVLASGSTGNAIWVASGSTRILIDAGLSARQIVQHLSRIGERPETLQAVCLTHEHRDHCRGLAQLQRRFGLALYANAPTAATVDAYAGGPGLAWIRFRTGEPFAIGALRVEPFAVPHDASESVGFVLSDASGARMALATDLGSIPPEVAARLLHCDLLVLEANHDTHLLRNSGRPARLIRRIAGPQGHLSNADTAEFLATAGGGLPRRVLLAHLSLDCNAPGLVLRAMDLAFAARPGAVRPDIRLAVPEGPGPRIVFGPAH